MEEAGGALSFEVVSVVASDLSENRKISSENGNAIPRRLYQRQAKPFALAGRNQTSTSCINAIKILMSHRLKVRQKNKRLLLKMYL